MNYRLVKDPKVNILVIILYYILSIVWQPQVLLGLMTLIFVLVFGRNDISDKTLYLKGHIFFYVLVDKNKWMRNMNFAIGPIAVIFLPEKYAKVLTTSMTREVDIIIKHLYGRGKQSLYLGPLYIPIILLPVMIWRFYVIITDKEKDRYLFWIERWADKLGGVTKEMRKRGGWNVK